MSSSWSMLPPVDVQARSQLCIPMIFFVVWLFHLSSDTFISCVCKRTSCWLLCVNNKFMLHNQASKFFYFFSARCNRRALAMMFVRLSVWVERALCTLAQISVYGWIVQCFGHPYTRACPLTLSRLFPVTLGGEVGYGCANYIGLDVHTNIDK